MTDDNNAMWDKVWRLTLHGLLIWAVIGGLYGIVMAIDRGRHFVWNWASYVAVLPWLALPVLVIVGFILTVVLYFRKYAKL